MKQLIAPVGAIVVAAWAGSVHADDARLEQGAVFCLTRGGIESAIPSFNKAQLESLGCVLVGRDLRVYVKDRFSSTIYKAVDIILPDKVLQGWAHERVGDKLPGLVFDDR